MSVYLIGLFLVLVASSVAWVELLFPAGSSIECRSALPDVRRARPSPAGHSWPLPAGSEIGESKVGSRDIVSHEADGAAAGAVMTNTPASRRLSQLRTALRETIPTTGSWAVRSPRPETEDG